MRQRQQKGPQSHYLILVNKKAAEYSRRSVSRLIGAIKRSGGNFTVEEPTSAVDLLNIGYRACGLKKSHHPLPQYMMRRGKVTSLIAAGGDGTVNLVAQIALKGDYPMGILPMGRFNNIARSFDPELDIGNFIKMIIKRNYLPIDTMKFDNEIVIGSLGIGFTVELYQLLKNKKAPRFGFRWASLSQKALSNVQAQKMTIKVESFRFDVNPAMLTVNMLPYVLGLPMTPISSTNDNLAEIIFDAGQAKNEISSFVKQVHKGRYIYGSSVRMYRGAAINIAPVNGRQALLDGEIVNVVKDEIELSINEQKLKIFC
ncbi:MAG: diacylglycerol kinase family protein [bacterium]